MGPLTPGGGSLREHLGEVLVAAAGEADDDELGVELGDTRERVRRLERRDDALRSREPPERRERLFVRRADVACAARVAQVRVLGPDAGVIEPGGDRVCIGDLAVLVGEDRGARAVEDAGPAAS